MTVLDAGSHKICALCARKGPDRGIEILAHSIQGSHGIDRGNITDLKSFAESVSETVAVLEQKTRAEITSAFVSVSGNQVAGCEAQGVTPLGEKPRQITSQDIKKTIELASAIYIPVDRAVIHTLAIDYAVDGQSGVTNPLGLYGRRLESRTHFITAKKSFTYNMLNGINAGGLEVESFIASAYASGLAVLSEDDRQKGGIVIDIGDSLCECSVFHKGAMKRLRVFELIGRDEAPDEQAYYHGIEDVLRAIQGHIDEFIHSEGILSQAVITGGGALDERIFDAAQAMLSVPTRIGLASGFSVDSELLANPSLATAFGMLNLVLVPGLSGILAGAPPAKETVVQKAITWAKTLYEEYF